MGMSDQGPENTSGGGGLPSSGSALSDDPDRTQSETGRKIKGISWDVWGTLLCRTAEDDAIAASRARLIAHASGLDADTALGFLDSGHPDEDASAGDRCIALSVAERLALALSRFEVATIDFEALADLISDLPIGKEVAAIDFSREVIAGLPCFHHVIISNTEWTTGSTLRGLLEGIYPAGVFQKMVFSDEVRLAKPNPRVFDAAWNDLGIDPSETVHIGDRPNRDLAGARSAGATAVISRVIRRAREKGDTKADAILYDYRGLPALLGYLRGVDTASGRDPIAEGLPVWGPLVIGRVNKVDRPDDESFAKMTQGSILLVNNSSPDFVPYFHRAGAVLAEVGGYGSHAAQTAPLCDTPCVVGLESLYDRLEDNDLVLVDATLGLVLRLDDDD